MTPWLFAFSFSSEAVTVELFIRVINGLGPLDELRTLRHVTQEASPMYMDRCGAMVHLANELQLLNQRKSAEKCSSRS